MSSMILSPFLISILWEAKNLRAFPPVVVSGFPNIIQIFILIWLMKMHIVPVFARTEVSFLSPCDIILAWSPIYESPISPSTSALGTSAATESITIIFTAQVFASSSAICSACSPWSGWERIKFSVSTPSFFA